MKIKKGDEVEIISGNDKGKRGTVRSVFPREGKIVVDGVNVRKKHARPRQAGKKGEVVHIPMPIQISRTLVICKKCNRGVRAGVRRDGGARTRICRRCGEGI